MPRKSARKKRNARRKKRGRRLGPGRLRIVLSIALTLAVLFIGFWIYLDVSVRARFEGRLWTEPARIYSDLLVLSVGDPIDTRELASRLERSGYARVGTDPAHPGQYRSSDGRIEIHGRAFATPTFEAPAARYDVRFPRGRIASIRDGDERRIRHARLEPELLATLYGARQEERSVLTFEELPQGFRLAVLAAEDHRFYEHAGLDGRGILRAAWANLRSGRIVQGGSTISQQTVKNLFLTQRRTWWRKAREAAMAWQLDRSFDKDRILEVYLNEVYLGQRGPVAICGAQAAARFYFGRDLERLSQGEWALLAGMIRSPGSYNPFRHPERALERRDQVIGALEGLGWLDAPEARAAESETLTLASGGGGYRGAPYVVDLVRSEVTRQFGEAWAEADGLRIYTTLDTRLQTASERALSVGLERLEKRAPDVVAQLDTRRLQGAVVVTRPVSGEILAMVGGRDYGESQFNRVEQARRQPGSCFKPFVFAAGFERAADGDPEGLTPATLLADEPIEIVVGGKSWAPANYDREFRGEVTVRRALEASLNVPTVRASQRVGLERIVELARDAGIRSRLSAIPSLPLGTEEVSPLELAAAYGTLAAHGVRRDPWIVRAVMNGDGESREARRPDDERVLRATSAYLTTDLMQGVFDTGTARSARALGFEGTAAGKTGTTDDTRDAWFVGYTPRLLALVWVGYDDNARTGLTGASGALPIWVDLMLEAGEGDNRKRFPEPRGIVKRYVDPESGELAARRCPQVVEESFARGAEPEERCHLHRRGGFWKRLTGRGPRAAP